MRVARSMLIACATISVFAAGAGGEEFRSNEGRFRFQAPPNWVRFAPATLAEIRVRVRGKLYGFLGKDTLVMIQCLSREQEFQQQEATFDTMAETFQYDPGFQFAALDAAKIGWIVAGIATSGCCVFAVLAIAIGTL